MPRTERGAAIRDDRAAVQMSTSATGRAPAERMAYGVRLLRVFPTEGLPIVHVCVACVPYSDRRGWSGVTQAGGSPDFPSASPPPDRPGQRACCPPRGDVGWSSPRLRRDGDRQLPADGRTAWRLRITDEWKAHPASPVRAAGSGLRGLHDALPIDTCPFDWSVDARLGQLTPQTTAHEQFSVPPAVDRLVMPRRRLRTKHPHRHRRTLRRAC